MAGGVPRRAGGGGLSRSAGGGWICPCCRRERAEGVRDELAGTQQALDAARVQATTAGSALRNARDAIRAAESRAKEVRGTGGMGMLGLREQGQCHRHSRGALGMLGAMGLVLCGHWE